MKHIILALTFTIIYNLAAPVSVTAQDLSSSADSAYLSGDYAKALQLYTEETETSGTSAALYYNIGNCNFRTGKYAKAILAYERSLRLDPTNQAAKSNLLLANSKIVDKKGYEGSLFSRTFSDITNLMSSNGWAAVALILFIITIAAVALYLFSNEVSLRKIGFFGGGATLILCIGTIILSISAYNIATSRAEAVVTVPSSILSTSPRAPQGRSEEAMLLHEGAKVTILDSIASPTDSLKSVWYDVRFDNEHRAWINSKDVEII